MIPTAVNNLSTLVLLVYATAIASVDLRTRRIPNWLNLSAAALAVTLGATAGVPGLLAAGSGLVIGGCMFLPFYLGGGFGGGDVKAMAAVGAFLGMQGAALAAAFTLVTGAMAAVFILFYRGASARQRFPYGVAIGCGTVASLWWLGRLNALVPESGT